MLSEKCKLCADQGAFDRSDAQRTQPTGDYLGPGIACWPWHAWVEAANLKRMMGRIRIRMVESGMMVGNENENVFQSHEVMTTH